MPHLRSRPNLGGIARRCNYKGWFVEGPSTFRHSARLVADAAEGNNTQDSMRQCDARLTQIHATHKGDRLTCPTDIFCS